MTAAPEFEWEADPVQRRLLGVLHALVLTRHALQVVSVQQEYAAGRLTVKQAFDAVRPLCGAEQDAVRIVRAMVAA